MKRRTFLQLGIFALAASASRVFAQIEAASVRIGRMSVAAFERLNMKGMAAVAAVRLDNRPLSPADQQLMTELALGGMMQLEVSRLALRKAVAPDVQILARAEVEEQVGLSTKLRELAGLKGAALPAKPDRRTRTMVAMLGKLSGPEFDQAYVVESGIRGHQLLDRTLTMVRAQAGDESLKEVAEAAHPLVRKHLKVSQEEAAQTT